MKLLSWLCVSACGYALFASSLACADGWDGYIGDFPGVPPMENWRPPHITYHFEIIELPKDFFSPERPSFESQTLPKTEPGNFGHIDMRSPTTIPFQAPLPPPTPNLWVPIEGLHR